MSEKPQRTIKIWFFVGVLFTIYVALILFAGVFIESPPHVRMQHLHIRIWWGLLLLVMGTFYTIRLWPTKKTRTDESDRGPSKDLESTESKRRLS